LAFPGQTVCKSARKTLDAQLRRTLLLPLDDLLAVTREIIRADVSRPGLDRCLRRHAAGNLNALKPQQPAPAHKAFKSCEPGYVRMDVKYLPQMQDQPPLGRFTDRRRSMQEQQVGWRLELELTRFRGRVLV